MFVTGLSCQRHCSHDSPANREHVVLDLFSNLNMGNIQWLLSVNLWDQVITLRGLFFVSRTSDDRHVLDNKGIIDGLCRRRNEVHLSESEGC